MQFVKNDDQFIIYDCSACGYSTCGHIPIPPESIRERVDEIKRLIKRLRGDLQAARTEIEARDLLIESYRVRLMATSLEIKLLRTRAENEHFSGRGITEEKGN